MLGVFSGKSETEKVKNKNLFYFRGFRGAAFILFCGGGGRAHLVQVCRVQGLPDLPEVGSGPLVLLLSALLPFVRCDALEICLYSRFKGVFSAVWGADVYLYGLRSLRGLCCFCVREWLGGFMARGVFAFVFHLL